MNKRLKLAILFLLSVSPLWGQSAAESLDKMIERGLGRAGEQALILADNLQDKPDALPKTFEKGELKFTSYRGWVSGFFPGELWLLYEATGNADYKALAQVFTERVEPAKKMTSTHDLGFMLYCSYGNGWRLTGDPHYLDVIKEGTESLLTRWNPDLGVMMSWDPNNRWKFPVIIDNMMNLEMLCFLSHETGVRRYEEIAITHANTTIRNHFREDGSSWHVVSYDPATGQPHAKQTGQGYSDDSAWARGQSWGLYGYTMMYRETLNPAFLEQARIIGRYLIDHPNLPANKVPYWDYNAPDIPHAQRDASSAAIMASALIELSQLDPGEMAPRWLEVAETQLRTLSSPEYLAEKGEQGGFLIKHGVGNLPGHSEVDVPLSYADYYYVEALLRLRKLLEHPTGKDDRREWTAKKAWNGIDVGADHHL